jgi:hypothetical protein
MNAWMGAKSARATAGATSTPILTSAGAMTCATAILRLPASVCGTGVTAQKCPECPECGGRIYETDGCITRCESCLLTDFEWEEREQPKQPMPKHGKSLQKVYADAVRKRFVGRSRKVNRS